MPRTSPRCASASRRPSTSWRICARSATRSRPPECPSVPAWSSRRRSCRPPPTRQRRLLPGGPGAAGFHRARRRRRRRPRAAAGAARGVRPDGVRRDRPVLRQSPRLLSWANTALTERAGTGSEFVTAACVTYLPRERLLRWAYAGHPPALSLDDGQRAVAPAQGTPARDPRRPRLCGGLAANDGRGGVVLYTDGLTEARYGGQLFGLDGVSAVLVGLHRPSPTEASPSCAHASPIRLRHPDRRHLPARRAHHLTACRAVELGRLARDLDVQARPATRWAVQRQRAVEGGDPVAEAA